jgi:hypothetical protein
LTTNPPDRRTLQVWYQTAIWKRIRRFHLRTEPLCRRCKARGLIVPARAVHHVEAHRGDWAKFIAGPFESLCTTCHNRDAQSEEVRGYSCDVDSNGYPTDPKHPFNRG